jgi:hypothetical protein
MRREYEGALLEFGDVFEGGGRRWHDARWMGAAGCEKIYSLKIAFSWCFGSAIYGAIF